MFQAFEEMKEEFRMLKVQSAQELLPNDNQFDEINTSTFEVLIPQLEFFVLFNLFQ